MRRLPDLNKRKRTFVRKISRVWYRNTGSFWPSFKERDNFAMRWTGYLKIKTGGMYNFYTYSDDGSKLWIDKSLVVNNDGLHGWRGRSGRKSMSAGYHTLKAEMFERGGWAGMDLRYYGSDSKRRHLTIPPSTLCFTGDIPTTTTTTPPPPPPPPKNCKPGVMEEAFYKINGMRRLPDLNKRKRTFVRKISRVWYRNTGSFWPSFKERDNFAMRWTGYLKIKTGGMYNFYTYSDDGSKLWIDKSLVVNNDGLHGWRGRSGRKSMSAGYHSLKAEMFERGGWAGMDLRYYGSDSNRRHVTIPPSTLFFTGDIPTTTTTTPPPPPPPPKNCKPGVMEEAFYKIYGMRRLPDLNKRKRTFVRKISRVWYRKG